MTLEQLFHALWARRARIALWSLLLVAVGSALILSRERAFVARAVVAPAETTGLAASALIAAWQPPQAPNLLETRPTGNFAVYLAALRSPEAVQMLAEQTSLLADLAAWREAGLSGWLRPLREAILGPARAPDLDDAALWLARSLSVTQSVISVTWTLELVHPDREVALDMLRRLHAHAEARVRADLLALAERRIAALEARIAAERDIYLRQPMFDLLAQHQRAAVVLAADEAAAARLVSEPAVEQNPSVPNRPLLFGLLLVAAPLAVCGIAAAAILARQPAPRQPDPAPREVMAVGRHWAGSPADLAGAARAEGGRGRPA
ncbi:MAG: hypothetical protein N2Z67_13015 [Acetobacteraceae bacterium]|nr:hypothetical protein [Acetobacteraceae bacterium]